jgi:transposase
MPFLKKEIKSSGTYIRIVESYRNSDGKSKHRTLYNLGKAEDYTKQTLKRIGKSFLELSGEDASLFEKKELHEVNRYNYGFLMIYHRVMQIYGLDKYFHKIQKKKKLSFPLYQSLLLMIVERLNEPSSKLSNFNHRQEYLGLEEVALHNLYRSLDQLYSVQDSVQKLIYEQGRDLFNQKLDIVFYDVTTFYFESENEDGFRMKGFSKDGKIGNTVIVFGMLIDKNKNPVGYRIYKGGYYEGHTFADAVSKLKQEYSIDRVITVADRGMMNRQNMELLKGEEIGYEYIIGERLKNLKQDVQDRILDRSKYTKIVVADDEIAEEIEIEYYVIEHDGKRIITTYSEHRARKDRHDREEKIEKAKDFMQNPCKVERKVASHFLKKTNKTGYELDEEKIAKNQRYDGFISISTDVNDLSIPQILDSYKQLYKIEHTFRTFKSYLESRPMFHWTEKRIEGHLCLCYICFTLLNYLQQSMQRKGIKLSENKLREVVGKMQVSHIDNGGDEFYLRSRQSEQSKMILQELKLRELPDVIGINAISQYITID